ncbi:hypothetical protein [Vibrio coralliirubri]|nr:hypothetical protein [Vibrio coralliirubri]
MVRARMIESDNGFESVEHPMLACLNQNCLLGESRDCEQLEGIVATA